MAIRIIDVEYSKLRRVGRAGRARSKDTLELIAAIESLTAGKAKALVVDRGESAAKLRAKLSNAARLAGVKLRIVIEENKVMFGLRRGGSAGAKAGAAARKQAVRQKAVQLGKGRKSITADDVLKALASDGFDLKMSRPATMVGAVLRNMAEFEHTDKNTFRFKG